MVSKITKKRVVITGIGPIASVGIGRKNFWNGLLSRDIKIDREKVYVKRDLWQSFYMHKIRNFDFNKININRDVLNYIKFWKEGAEIKDLYFFIAAIKLAIDDANFCKPEDLNAAGLVLAHENMGLSEFFNSVSEHAYRLACKKNKIDKLNFFKKLSAECIKVGYDAQTFMSLFHISKMFNVHGFSIFINNACSSGLYALELAREMICCNQSKISIVAAVDLPDIYKYLWLKKFNFYSGEKFIKPFSKDGGGLVFGEGAVALIVEDLDHALKRGANIYAEYAGGGFQLESWRVFDPRVDGAYYQKAIADSLSNSSLTRDNIDLICLHGMGSYVADACEINAIKKIFGNKKNQPYITAFKPYIGHCLGSSALLETAILLLCMKHNIILPVLNTKEFHPSFNMNIVQKEIKSPLNVSLKTSAAFAGYIASAIFRKFK